MKPRHFLSTSLVACLLATASRATIFPYAEYHLGEAGSLGASNKPQDSTGNNHHIPNVAGGESATVATTGLSPNATGSTACLDTSNPANEGWYGEPNTYATLPTDNFAFGVFARAAAIGNPTRGDVFTLGDVAGSHKLSLEGTGWSSSAHNVDWIAPAGGVPGSFTPNTWVHLAIVRSAGVSTFYIDGVAHGTFSGDAVHAAPHISVQPGGGEFGFFDGQLDEARIVTFTPGQSPESVIAALQGGVVPTAFFELGVGATYNAANLSTDEESTFRLGGAIQDSVVITGDGGLSVAAGSAPKHIIHISQEGGIPTGSYPLIYYTGSIGGLGFDGLQLAPLPGRITGSLVNNTVDSTIDLVISGSEAGDITWTGSGGDIWNVEGNSNWVFTNTTTPTKFFPGDVVRFNDTAATNAVTIAQTVTPGAIYIPANEDYSFNGAGGIGGSATLEKSGTGTLTFTNPNTHSGEIYIDAGTVRVGDGGSTGSLGTGPMGLEGNLIVNRSGTLNMPNSIGGSGSIEKLGDGRLVMSGSSSFEGTVTLTSGVIASGHANCLGSPGTGTTVAAGATLDAFSGGFGNEPITINGTGVNAEGAIINTGAANQLDGVKFLILGSDSSIGGANRWDVRGDDATITGGFTLTKIGTGQVSIVNADVSVPNIVIDGGMLSLERGANVDNSSPGTITVNGTVLGFGDFGIPIVCTKPILMSGGRMTTTSQDANGSAIIDSPVQLEDTATIQTWSGTTLTYNGAFTGSGSLVKDDFGTAILTGAHSWAGDTTVALGTLSFAASGLADTSTVTVGKAATLNLGFSGTDTVSAMFINGIQLAPGVYNASHDSGRLAGTGSLTVSTGPVGTPYQLWASASGIGGAGSAEDSDNDGISNGIEFVIGSDPSGPGSDSNALRPTATTTATHLVFIYRRADESAAFAPFVQYGSDLSGWNTAVNGTNGITILEEDDAIATGINRVTVSIPVPANGQSLFARLQATTF
ncbi:autotransporter-associated beta strand repeat-containing protein [Luteolibacter sp. Populi]|uniref:autotransporter-associated beta strand repeat-containing protein n=1 Tax=Luteolibacter sp. Populi TaxID=3230487 RepID=UPI0034668212